MTFEENLARLEAIAASLDRADLSLEDALSLFEEGIAKLKAATTELGKAEARVKTLVERADGVFETTDVDD